MEPINFEKHDNGFHITDFPDAVKVIKLSCEKSILVSDLSLHKYDLNFANDALETINLIPEENHLVREALWQAAIINFLKCFKTSNARGKLEINKILDGDKTGQEIFQFFCALRDKHIAHDDNSLSNAPCGAIIANKNKSYKIEKIIAMPTKGIVLQQENWNNLKLLVTHTQQHVEKSFTILCNELTAELETISYEDLISRDPLQLQKPDIKDINKTRKRI